MRILPKAVLVVLLLATAAQADIFRCRNTAGRLVFTDDPALFPAGCKAEPSPPPGALSVVPLPVPAGARQRAEAFIQAREERQQAGQEQLAGWLDAARSIVEDFRQAQRQRYYPRQRSQAAINQALQGMTRAAQDKTDLLQAMDAQGASPDEVQQVTRLLEGVQAP